MELTNKPTVLIVDDAPDNLMLIAMLLQGHCKVQPATSGTLALQIARKTPHPDLILLDVLMPEMDGYDVCTQLKQDKSTADIPVIFLTSRILAEDQRRGFQAGAVDYITKPINPDVLQARVSTHLQLKALRAMLQDQSVHLEHLATQRLREMLHKQDEPHPRSASLPAHIQRIQHLVAALARHLQSQGQTAHSLSDADITLLFRALALHGISNPQALANEMALLASDAQAADDQASQTFLRFVHEINQAQHEKYDGSGPQGLSGKQIALSARLFQLAKVYEHLMSSRDYKPALPHDEALAVLRRQRGLHFDPDIVDAALAIADQLQAIVQQYVEQDSGGMN